MLSLAHTLISLPIGLNLSNPFAIFITAFVFHFLADSLLHWNIDPEKRSHYTLYFIALDVFGGLTLSWLIISHQLFTLPVIIAIFSSNLPDIIQVTWHLFGNKRYGKYFKWLLPFFNFHEKIQFETNNIPQGLASQIILIAISLTLIL